MQNIDSDLIRGNIDTIILKTMLNGDMYGLDIIREVENKSNGTYELKQPTLYSCLKRLENQELISSYWLDSDIGGRRHYYKLTEKGRDTIKSKQEEWSKSKFIIDNLLGDFDSEEYRLVKKDDYEKIIEGKPVIQYITIPAEPKENLSSQEQNDSDEFQNSKSTEQAISDEKIIESEETPTPNTPEIEPVIENPVQTLSDYQNLIDNVLNFNGTISQAEPSVIEFNNKEINKNEKTTNSQNTVLNSNTENNSNEQHRQTFSLDGKNFVQQNLFTDTIMPYQSEVDNSIFEFNKNISLLSNFDYSDETKKQEEKIQAEQRKNNISNDNINQPAKITEIESSDIDNEKIHTENSNTNILNELNSLRQRNQTIFDDADYNVVDTNKNNLDNNTNSSSVNSEKTANEPNIFENSVKNQSNSAENQFIDYKVNLNENYGLEANNYEIYGNYDESNNSPNTSDFLFDNSEPEAFFELKGTAFVPTNENEPYKKKLQNLNEYTKISNYNPTLKNISGTKGIVDLKKDFESEGIKLKQYKNIDKNPAEKSYLLINKLNVIKSLILFFTYAFILSASYIIMKNTDLKNIQDFSINLFLYAMIPFLVYLIFYFVIFLANSRKKINSKYSPRISMFFAIIITIQLIIIIYCINLQFGFYSFSQVGYNHLYWIIPAIISLAPILNSIIHIALYNSKNFNV